MRKLLQEIWATLRKHPVLWLPVVVADVVEYFLQAERRSAIFYAMDLVLNWMRPHSAFGGPRVGSNTQAGFLLADVVGYFLEYFGLFLTQFCSVFALFITAKLVQSMGRSEEQKLRFSYTRREINGMALVALVYLALGEVTLFLYRPLWSKLVLSGTMTHTLIIRLAYLPEALCADLLIAFLASPLILRFLRPRGAIVALNTRSLSRKIFFGMAFISTILGALRRMVPLSASFTHAQSMAADIVLHLIVALPYALIYVGFGLLAFRENPGTNTHALEAEVVVPDYAVTSDPSVSP